VPGEIVKQQILALTFMLSLFAGCQSSVEPEHGIVTWYISNTTGTRTTLNVYDLVCNKSHFRIRVPRTGELPIETCANNEGNAVFRYRRAGGYTGAENQWINSEMRSNQTLLVRQ
jgi:hypothetical protein